MKKLFNGTIARVATQCTHPITGTVGTFLFTCDDHKKTENVISEPFPSSHEMHHWALEEGWESIGSAYRYAGPTKDIDV